MSRVKLTIATTDYDHFRDFRLGITNAEGIDHTWLTLGHHEVFARFTSTGSGTSASCHSRNSAPR